MVGQSKRIRPCSLRRIGSFVTVPPAVPGPRHRRESSRERPAHPLPRHRGNVVGLAAGVLAVYGVQVLFTRTLPGGGFGLLTVAVQVAFVAAAGSRFGMDLSTVRDVAIGIGAGHPRPAQPGRPLRRHRRPGQHGVAVAHGRAVAAVRRVRHRDCDRLRLDPAGRGGQHLPGRDPRAEADGPDALGLTGSASRWPGWGWPGSRSRWAAAPTSAVWTYDASWLCSRCSPAACGGSRPGWATSGRAASSCARAALRRAPGPLRPARPGPVLGRPVGAGPLPRRRRGRHLLGRRPDRPGGAAVPDLLQPALLAVRGRPPCPRRARELDALFKRATRWALMGTIPAVIVLAVAARPRCRCTATATPRAAPPCASCWPGSWPTWPPAASGSS